MASRYQFQTQYAEQGPVTTYEGLDPLTGLPVLIYQFEGDSAPGLRDLESENIPGLLGVESVDGKTHVIVAYSKDYEAASSAPAVDVHTLLLDSARALKDAAQAGVVHGDLKPARFLVGDKHVLVEGFGMPWPFENSAYRAPEETQATFAGDVYAWGKSMLELCEANLSDGARNVLASAIVADPSARPAASEVHSSLKRIKPAAVQKKSFEDVELTFSTGDFAPSESQSVPEEQASPAVDFTLSEEPVPERLEPAPFVPPPPPVTEAPVADTGGVFTLPEPEQEEQAAQKRPATSGSGDSFVKNLPPGATYRAGDSTPQLRPALFEEYTFTDAPKRNPERLRRLVLLLLLLLSAAALAYLAFWQQRRTEVPAPTTSAAAYIVEVTLAPANAPPSDLYVVSSPEGTRRYPAGAIVQARLDPGSNNIVLDSEGRWQLQVRFQDRASDVATFELPQQRAVTLTLPPGN